MRGKRISVGQMGGSVKATTDLMMRSAGMDPAKDIKPEYLGHADAVAALSDKRIDGSVTVFCATLLISGIGLLAYRRFARAENEKTELAQARLDESRPGCDF